MIRKYIEKKLDEKDISLEVEISDTNYELLIELFREVFAKFSFEILSSSNKVNYGKQKLHKVLNVSLEMIASAINVSPDEMAGCLL